MFEPELRALHEQVLALMRIPPSAFRLKAWATAVAWRDIAIMKCGRWGGGVHARG